MTDDEVIAQGLRNRKGNGRGMNPRSRANLNPPQRPGDPSLNPGGMPKGISITAEMNRLLAMDPRAIQRMEPQTGAEMLARGIFVRATGKSDLLAKATWDRVDGLQVQQQEQRVIMSVDEMDAEQLRAYMAALLRGDRSVDGDKPAD